MEQIGRYEQYEEIGRGSMGIVYRASDTRLQREVALKLLPAYLSQDGTFSQRFQREAQIIAQLEHPHIVPIYDVGEVEGRPFLVMRLLKGGTLRQRLTARDLTPQALIHILQQVTQALDATHNRGVVHRDIKPSNILFDEQGTVFIADFGIAKVLNATTQGVVGTPAYMSPEHFTGQGLDGRSDQYSLAIVIYEALTGELPFNGVTIPQLVYQHLESAPRQVHEVNSLLPSTLSLVISQALTKQPADRFSTTGAFALAFARALETPAPKMPVPVVLPATVEAAAVVLPVPVEKLPLAKPHEKPSKTTAAQKLHRLYSQGLQALSDEDWTVAAAAFAKVLEMEPNHPKARSRYREAVQHLGEDAKPAPGTPSSTSGKPRRVAVPTVPPEAPKPPEIVVGAGGQTHSGEILAKLNQDYESGLTAMRAENWAAAIDAFRSVEEVNRYYRSAVVLRRSCERRLTNQKHILKGAKSVTDKSVTLPLVEKIPVKTSIFEGAGGSSSVRPAPIRRSAWKFTILIFLVFGLIFAVFMMWR